MSYRDVILRNIEYWDRRGVPEAVARWREELVIFDMPAPQPKRKLTEQPQ